MTTTATIPKVGKINWTEVKSKLRTKYPVLTDADFSAVEGNNDEVHERIQKKLGKTKEEVAMILSNL